MNAERQRLRCNVAQIDDIFPACLAEAQKLLSPAGVDAWLDGTSTVCRLGRGQDLPVIFLQAMPGVARIAGEAIIGDVVELAAWLSRITQPKAIAPFLSKLAPCVRRLETLDLMRFWFDIVRQVAEQAPTGLVPFLHNSDALLGQICIGSVRNWVNYGLRTYRHRLHEAGDYFSLQGADARAALQRERKGTLLVDHSRQLLLTLRALWQQEEELLPYSLAFDLERRPKPHLDRDGFHLPDVYEDVGGPGGDVSGLDRYRAALAHLAAHRRWTTPIIADNYNRYQQIFIEVFEDARVEWLAMQSYPGLRKLWLALHPKPRPGDCPEGHSCIRHLAAMLSRALLDPQHGYTDAKLLAAVARFHERMAAGNTETRTAADMGVDYLVQVHHVDFRSPKVFFRDTEVSYRDDNRFLWIFLEDTDDEDDFHSDHQVANPKAAEDQERNLFARYQPEWDYEIESYRPDWATVYESVLPSGDAAHMDRLIEKHAPLAKKLKALVDLLKPQNRVRQRYQEEGTELDLDVALRAMLDYKAGATPDPRIHMNHRPDARDISVMVLLDLSQSVNNPVADSSGGPATVLELAQEAMALLGWSLDALGDPYAIAGFASDTRHNVRYYHFKGYAEPWGEEVKARLAGMQGALSTRMGTALRHAGHYLAHQPSEKKLLLLLTDGEPADIDVDDPLYLHADARKAVEELGGKGIATWCLSLDPKADAYVKNIFGHHYRVLDKVERLPETLPALYMQLTR